MKARYLLSAALLLAAGALWADTATDDLAKAGIGADLAVTPACGQCHLEIAKDFARLSTHSLLYDCNRCHVVADALAGKGHATSTTCAECHSEKSHPDSAGCQNCHAVHGSRNAALIRDALVIAQTVTAVDYQLPLGNDPQGLAHGGRGICETCHTKTKYYSALALGAPHPTAYCGTCHDHQAGFAGGEPF